MKKDISICILRVGGTNCDQETKTALESAGARAEIVHTNRLIHNGDLLEYQGLVLPGGFSFGDHVRAGAIWGDIIKHELREQITAFVDAERPVLGICNGFQALVETGILPGLDGSKTVSGVALAGNIPSGYRCTWTAEDSFIYLRNENLGKCIFTRCIPQGKLLRLPIAHAEGRLLFPPDEEEEVFKRMNEQDQIVFRFCLEDGTYANDRFPFNPNGSAYDIAGICNSAGTVCGMMPHPERAFFGYQLPDWTANDNPPAYGDGRLIFQSMIDYISSRF